MMHRATPHTVTLNKGLDEGLLWAIWQLAGSWMAAGGKGLPERRNDARGDADTGHLKKGLDEGLLWIIWQLPGRPG